MSAREDENFELFCATGKAMAKSTLGMEAKSIFRL
jgi:hypothetical protein